MAIQFVKSQFMRTSEGTSKKLTINSDEESSLVDKRFEPLARRSQISNLGLVKDIVYIIEYLHNTSAV